MSGQRQIKELNWLGKAVLLASQGVEFTADLIGSVINIAAVAYADAERAFKQGLDPKIDEANILEERTHEQLHNDDN